MDQFDQFSDAVIAKLNEKLPGSVVSTRASYDGGKGTLSYLEGWYVQDQLNQIFGFGNWHQSVDALDEVYRGTSDKTNSKTGAKYTNVVTVWKAVVTLNVRDAEGGWVHRTDVGCGVGEGSNAALILEKTIKEAVTDGIKRAAKSFGNQFGLALYDKEQANVMSSQEEGFHAMRTIAQTFMDNQDVAGVSAWYANNHAGLWKARDKYPSMAGEIDNLLTSVEDFLKRKAPAKDDPALSTDPDDAGA